MWRWSEAPKAFSSACHLTWSRALPSGPVDPGARIPPHDSRTRSPPPRPVDSGAGIPPRHSHTWSPPPASSPREPSSRRATTPTLPPPTTPHSPTPPSPPTLSHLPCVVYMPRPGIDPTTQVCEAMSVAADGGESNVLTMRFTCAAGISIKRNAPRHKCEDIPSVGTRQPVAPPTKPRLWSCVVARMLTPPSLPPPPTHTHPVGNLFGFYVHARAVAWRAGLAFQLKQPGGGGPGRGGLQGASSALPHRPALCNAVIAALPSFAPPPPQSSGDPAAARAAARAIACAPGQPTW